VTNYEWFSVVGIIATWAAGIFAYGKMYGALVSKLNEHEKRLSKAESMFFNKDGDPRLLTYAAHEQIAEACQKNMLNLIHASKERIDRHDEKLDSILHGIGDIKVLLATKQNIGDKR
jgi:hypothetical protein